MVSIGYGSLSHHIGGAIGSNMLCARATLMRTHFIKIALYNYKSRTYKCDAGCPPVDSAVGTFQGSTDAGRVMGSIVLTALGQETITV